MLRTPTSTNGFLNLATQNVLVVEDNRPTQILLRDVLRGFGFRQISAADDMDKAWGLIVSQTFDLIIVDVALGVSDGLDLVARSRASNDPRISRTGIVVVTSHATEARVVQAGAQGVHGFVAQPITVSRLARPLGNALTGQGPMVAQPAAAARVAAQAAAKSATVEL